jgi:hypothetical protein
VARATFDDVAGDSNRQTSVRVPHEAVACLERVAEERGLSRDAAVRALLEEYLAFQGSQPPDERLTHVSTVLRFPPLPPGRGRPDPRAHLRFRISSTLKRDVIKYAFVLPGQSARHGHHDYAARPLTDAVVTAIALVEPVVLDGLERLPQLLPHRTALGLWRLVVAATLTQAERRAIWGADSSSLFPVLGEEEVAWHHPWRYAVAHVLPQNICGQPADDVAEVLAMVHDQTEAFRDLLYWVRRRDESTYWLCHNVPPPMNNVMGRGGSAVWRARRKLALEGVAIWLASTRFKRRTIAAPPGWKLTLPDGWRVRSFAFGEAVPHALEELASTGQVARAAVGSRTVFWPLTEGGPPIAGFDAVLRCGGGLDPARLAEVILTRLDYPHVAVPAAMAKELGFITSAERDGLIADAATANAASVASTLKNAKRRLDADDYAELVAAAGDLEKFAKLSRRHYFRSAIREPTWAWDARGRRGPGSGAVAHRGDAPDHDPAARDRHGACVEQSLLAGGTPDEETDV